MELNVQNIFMQRINPEELGMLVKQEILNTHMMLQPQDIQILQMHGKTSGGGLIQVSFNVFINVRQPDVYDTIAIAIDMDISEISMGRNRVDTNKLMHISHAPFIARTLRGRNHNGKILGAGFTVMGAIDTTLANPDFNYKNNLARAIMNNAEIHPAPKPQYDSPTPTQQTRKGFFGGFFS